MLPTNLRRKISTSSATNLVCNMLHVKPTLKFLSIMAREMRSSVDALITPYARDARLLATALLVSSSALSAQPGVERAIENAQQLTTFLHGVVYEQMPLMVERIANHEIERIAPEQPVWIIEIIDNTILYYQGRPELSGAPIDALADSQGQPFGLRAAEYGRQSRSAWLLLHFDGVDYRAYCKSQYPTVVCSVVLN